MNQAASDQGFTLIELIVVMVLISMMTAFAFPKIRSSLFTNQLRATARRFIGLVAETGEEARSRMMEIELRFDPAKHSFTAVPVTDTVTDNSVLNGLTLSVPESVEVVDVTSAHGGVSSRGTLLIHFTAQGYVDKTVVHFQDDDNELSVFLSPFLCVTRVMDGYVSLDDDPISRMLP